MQLAFALGQHATLPAGNPPRIELKAVDDPAFTIDARKAALEAKVYAQNCVWCHGFRLENFASIAPDLRESRLALNWNGFRAVLHDGTLASLGMPKYDNLSDDELLALHMYVRSVAREAARKGTTGHGARSSRTGS